MKRSIVIAVVMVLMATVVNAQDFLKPGQLVVSGATSLTVNRQTFSEKDVEETMTNTSTLVDVGGAYFITKSIGIGVMLLGQNTSFSASGTGASDNNTLTTYGVGPLLVLRFGSGKVSFNIRGGAGLGKNSVKAGSETTDTDLKFFQGGGGIAFHINELASFDVGLHYQKSTIKDASAGANDPSQDASGFVVGLGFSLSFGGR